MRFRNSDCQTQWKQKYLMSSVNMSRPMKCCSCNEEKKRLVQFPHGMKSRPASVQARVFVINLRAAPFIFPMIHFTR